MSGEVNALLHDNMDRCRKTATLVLDRQEKTHKFQGTIASTNWMF